ncbi:putative defense protein 3 [Neocloeon triangulifer]|uniref:putative defense protein 3 n=1 Tax=Neocloeon triangulifer TaxID=2078957 RepID=UPI00286F5A3C|nr:putative defense protein 3 [Neocloeon triangulifer]XP_059475169.1 putative defense protein 3 [Neocloeon triangulifer]
MLKYVVLCALLVAGARASPTGAPAIACDAMTPSHNGTAPQTGPAPYTLTATAIDAQTVQVSIEADAGVTFRGFFIQGRSVDTDTAVGTFAPSADAQSIDCFSNPASASTHLDRTDKTSVSVLWTAPASGEAVNVVVSIVQTFNVFWVKIPVTILY